MVAFNPKFYRTKREVNQWFEILYLLLKTKTLRHIFLLNKFVWVSGVLEILETLNIRRKLKALKIGVKNRYGSLKENKRSFHISLLDLNG